MVTADPHRLAQDLSSQAELAERSGDRETARTLFVQAARWEMAAIESLPPERERTRTILSVSAVAQLFKGGAFDEAEAAALRFLGESGLSDFGKNELRDTIQAIWERQNLARSNRKLNEDVVYVAIRGSEIGSGKAPMGLVVDKIIGVRSLLYRLTEWKGGFPLRTRGGPTEEIRELCQPWVGEPQAGSYKFAIRLAEPLQPSLLSQPPVKSSDISESLLAVIGLLSPTRPGHRSESLDRLIPDKAYRQAIVQLVRNIVPDGKRVREMEFIDASSPSLNSAILLPNSRFVIDETLKSEKASERPHQVDGVLRALHLDLGWVEITKDDGQRVRGRIGRQVLDDVIGPMVNRHVIARGKWVGATGRFTVADIELNTSIADNDANA